MSAIVCCINLLLWVVMKKLKIRNRYLVYKEFKDMLSHFPIVYSEYKHSIIRWTWRFNRNTTSHEGISWMGTRQSRDSTYTQTNKQTTHIGDHIRVIPEYRRASSLSLVNWPNPDRHVHVDPVTTIHSATWDRTEEDEEVVARHRWCPGGLYYKYDTIIEMIYVL